ncbi:uncharacterized protein LOC124643288 [Helicoverpa zea]|uniref:uncharacterized protein LOC124643288 n=1 Tax=Helicoverpa zea TaxID=7113 RepID=UPI001F59E5AC|nr:uncharacterized protein LOC124643288 [Helicoverpa zea]
MNHELSDDANDGGSSNSSLIEHEVDQRREEDTMQIEISNNAKPEKRERDGSDTEWQEVRKDKKFKECDKVEVYISWNEELPKQFALAKLLKQEGIKDINKVKYINKFRVRIEFSSNLSAFKLEQCKSFVDKGWRFQRAMEKNYSYGVIKDVDMDISDEEILKRIVCPNAVPLVSARRLNKRNRDKNTNEGTWLKSEAIQLCFKGPSIPAYIYVDELRINVDPYIFPVTQCTRCWKFGHSMKTCTSNKIVCPKCGENHANCETISFKCVNCKGSHMALTKTCPEFLKEKKIRDLMAEFNCTYRKALSIYVPPDIPSETSKDDIIPNEYIKSPLPKSHYISPSYAGSTPTFADIVKINTKAVIHKEDLPSPATHVLKKQAKTNLKETHDIIEDNSYNTTLETPKNEKENKQKDVNFVELLSRLKEIIFLKNVSYQTKFYRIMKSCVEWVILVVVDNIADWPILKKIFDFVNG